MLGDDAGSPSASSIAARASSTDVNGLTGSICSDFSTHVRIAAATCFPERTEPPRDDRSAQPASEQERERDRSNLEDVGARVDGSLNVDRQRDAQFLPVALP